MTIKLITSFVLAFLFATAFGKYYIPWLRAQKAGQEIKGQVEWHKSKSGTPTMGGVMFILAVTFVCLTVGFEGMLQGNFVHIFVLLFAWVFGLIGFLDDWEKLKKKQNLGLTAKMKFLLQLVAALVFVLLMREIGYVRPNLYIPFSNKVIPMPEWLYFVFASFVIVGTVNAVNITDGLDGLSSSVTVPVSVFFLVMAVIWSGFQQLGVFSGALVGGLLGFLVYNHYPAKVFMGDTGSLFLGGAVAALAFAYDMPLVLILVGIVYICETLSDILQVGYFKLTHGKRIFKMAPLHHHFEMCGWKETKIVAVFTAVSTLFCVIAYFAVYQRFSF